MNIKETETSDHFVSHDKGELVIEIKNLSKSFGTQEVLKDISLNLYKGENLVVLGKSGTGKSVLIKCIVGLLTYDSGTISLFGKDVENSTRQELALLRQKTGFLFQSGALYDSMTVIRSRLKKSASSSWKFRRNTKHRQLLSLTI